MGLLAGTYVFGENVIPTDVWWSLPIKSADVDAYFRTATTGFAAQFKTFLTNVGTATTAQQTALNKSNTSIDNQIADIERRLVQQRELMTSAFIAMESAQQRIQTQSAALTNAFKAPTT